MRKLTPEELAVARHEKWQCCVECGKKLPARGFCSAACRVIYQEETPYWQALERGVPPSEAEALLPAASPTRNALAAVQETMRRKREMLQ
jgi:hypothetical protein